MLLAFLFGRELVLAKSLLIEGNSFGALALVEFDSCKKIEISAITQNFVIIFGVGVVGSLGFFMLILDLVI